MGFFKAIGRFVGRAVEKVGDVFGSEKLSGFGRSIQNACAEKIATEKSYDKQSANIQMTDRLNDILLDFSEGYLQQAISIENACIRKVREFYDMLIGVIEDSPETAKNKANLRMLKSGRDKIDKSITNKIKDPLAKRMSLDDSECLKILQMEAGSEKRVAMTRFTKKVINEALNDLAKSVRETLNEQTEDIKDYLENVMEEKEKEVLNLKNYYDSMCQKDLSEVGDREKSCINSLITLDASEQIMNILS